MFWGATAPADAVNPSSYPPEVGENPRKTLAAAANANAAAAAAAADTAASNSGANANANAAGSSSRPTNNEDEKDAPSTLSRGSGVSSLNILTGKVQVRPWTPTPFGYRNELRDKRQVLVTMVSAASLAPL